MHSTQSVDHGALLAELLDEYIAARQHGIDVELAHAYDSGITDIVHVANPDDDEIVKRVREALG